MIFNFCLHGNQQTMKIVNVLLMWENFGSSSMGLNFWIAIWKCQRSGCESNFLIIVLAILKYFGKLLLINYLPLVRIVLMKCYDNPAILLGRQIRANLKNWNEKLPLIRSFFPSNLISPICNLPITNCFVLISDSSVSGTLIPLLFFIAFICKAQQKYIYVLEKNS